MWNTPPMWCGESQIGEAAILPNEKTALGERLGKREEWHDSRWLATTVPGAKRRSTGKCLAEAETLDRVAGNDPM